ncbi:cache domain-containing protein, partial [Paraburkholderia sp. BR14264]|uniref:cache domain-containing protein n=1 Tax=Paraburkholderia sp. BR14264 TaxID=3237001 RepID=UPI0039795210
MEWYKEAMQNIGKSIVAPAYTSKATGNLVITIARATNDGNGVVGMNVNLDKIKEITGSIKIGKQGYVYVLDTEHKFIYHPEKKAGSVAPDNVQNNNLYKNETGSFQYLYNDKEKKEMVYTTNELTG